MYIYLIANELDFSIESKWLGFIVLFVNHAVSKYFFYYPALTDPLAFLLAMLMLLFFLKNNKTLLIITTIIGAFTWPLLVYFGLLLYIFPNKGLEFYARKRLSLILSVFAAFAVLAIIVWGHFMNKFVMPHAGAQVVDSVVVLSITCTLVYIVFGLRFHLDNIGIPDIHTIVNQPV